jgi:cellobiose phosphorylase
VKIGRGDKAMESLMKIFSDNLTNPGALSGVTPFALTSSYSTKPEIWGKAGRPWLTGTQSWVMRTIVEGFLGVKRECSGIKISPAFPSDWEQAECKISIKEVEYVVKIKRLNSAGKMKVYLDGKPMETGFIPFQDVGVHIIKVEV